MKQFYLLTKTLLMAVCLGGANFVWGETTTVGNTDNNSDFWKEFSDYYTVEPNGTLVVSFTNYSKKDNNYQNWCAVVTTNHDRVGGTQSKDTYYEYALLRADNMAWRAGDYTGTNTFDGTDKSWATLTSSYDWDNFKTDMDGSKVIMSVSRSGTQVKIYADITTSEGLRRWEKLVINDTKADETLRFFLTVDHAHLENVAKSTAQSFIGATDYTSGYLAESSDAVTLKPGDSYRYRFVNHYNGGSNWLNWHLPVKNPSGTNVFVLRVDWYEDINGGDEISGHQRGFTSNAVNIWNYVPSKMNGVTVDMTVTFTADKKFIMTSTNTATDGTTTWTYNYTSDNDNNVDLTGYDNLTVALSENTAWLELLSEEKTAVGAKISSTTGYATFSSTYPVNVDVAGLEAYIATGKNGDYITMEQVTGDIAANTGLVLKGDVGTYSLPVVASGNTQSGNLLQPCDGSWTTLKKSDDGTNYVLSEQGDPKAAVFAPIGETTATLRAGVAYLYISGVSSSARALRFSFSDNTGVENVKVAEATVKKNGAYLENGKIAIYKNGLKFNAAGQQMK